MLNIQSQFVLCIKNDDRPLPAQDHLIKVQDNGRTKMLLSLIRSLSSKPDSEVKADLNQQEWDRLQMILREENQDALVLWLKQTAYKSYQLQKNFDMAAGGKKSKFCLSKTVALENEFMARAAAYKRAIATGWIDGPKIPRLYSAPMYSFIRYHFPEADID